MAKKKSLEERRAEFEDLKTKTSNERRRKKKKFDTRIKALDYEKTYEINGWLELGGWKMEEGICLICGISPTGADISWSGYENSAGMHIDKPRIENVGFLDEDIYTVPRHQIKTGDCDEEIEYKNYRISQVEGTLQRAWRLFYRDTRHFGDMLRPPLHYIDWAKEKQIPITWLKWAEEKGLLPMKKQDSIPSDPAPSPNLSPQAEITSPNLRPRAETTYKHIIGALLEIMLGENKLKKPNSIFRNQSAIINELLERFGNRSGIKKRTLEQKFSEAKKSLHE